MLSPKSDDKHCFFFVDHDLVLSASLPLHLQIWSVADFFFCELVCRAVQCWPKRERWGRCGCQRVGQTREKRDWSQTKVRRGREMVGLQEWSCNQVSISVSASLGLRPAYGVGCRICVCALEGVMGGGGWGLDYCSKAWPSICACSPFPLQCYRSVNIKTWPCALCRLS